MVEIPHIHELDQAQGVAGAPKVFDQCRYALVIDATLHHGVDLQAMETRSLGGRNAIQHPPDAAMASTHAGKHMFVQAVQAHRDTPQARIRQRAGMARQ